MGSIKITKTDSTKAKGDKILPVITKTEAMILKEIETVGSSYRVIKEYNCSGEPITEKRWMKAMHSLLSSGLVSMKFRILDQRSSSLFEASTLLVS